MYIEKTGEALKILNDSIKELQSEKGSILSGVENLLHAANLLGEDDISMWCEIQLGNKDITYELKEYINILKKAT